VSAGACCAKMVGAVLELERRAASFAAIRVSDPLRERCYQNDLAFHSTIQVLLHSILCYAPQDEVSFHIQFFTICPVAMLSGSLLPHVHSPRDLQARALAALEPACSPATLINLSSTRRRLPTQQPVLYRSSLSPKYESRWKIGPGSQPVHPPFSASRAHGRAGAANF
jgi:hypothetical protein